MPPVADKKIDCVGLFCPVPVVRTAEALRQLGPGQVLEMTSDDPACPADMKSWSARTGHELLEIDKNGAIFRFVLRKAG